MSSTIKQAMILAAGRGERMRPLTDNCPKPLLKIAGKALIEYHIEALARAGIEKIVINHAWLGEVIEQHLADGSNYDVRIIYSREGTALNTGGGIKHALPHFNDEPFILVNGDVWCDLDFSKLTEHQLGNKLAHILLVPNPEQHPEGDFALADGLVAAEGSNKFTYSGIGLYSPKLLSNEPEGNFPLAPILQQAMSMERISGDLYQGHWYDIGTPERLQQLEQLLTNS